MLPPNSVLLRSSVIAVLYCMGSNLLAQTKPNPPERKATSVCAAESALTLPAGFCATVFADGIGHARHLVVAPDGTLYVNTWSGDYYNFDQVHEGGFLVALQDKSGAGKAGTIERFGETVKTGGTGGTGIAFYNGAVYAESNDRYRALCDSRRSATPARSNGNRRFRIALGRRPPDASVHHRSGRRPVY